MALSTLDAKTALIVIDLQKGIITAPAVHPITDVIARSAELATAFRKKNLPVVLVNVAGRAPGRTAAGGAGEQTPPADWTELVPELGVQPSDHLVTKHRWGAFHGTDLHDYLQENEITQVVITGVATSVGVESTARFAGEYGYNVALATDAMTDTNADTHQNSIERIFPKLGETATTKEILDML